MGGIDWPEWPSRADMTAAIRAEFGSPADVLIPAPAPGKRRIDPCDAHLADLERVFPHGMPKAVDAVVKFV